MQEGGKQVKTVRYSRTFLKHAGKLPERIIDLAEEKERIFKEDAFHRSLGTHKLHGKEKEYWAFWINRSYRIKFAFLPNGEVLFLDIGTHNIYE